MITSKYNVAHFADILEKVSRDFIIDDATEYACIGIRLAGKGVFVRECKSGLSISRKKQGLVKSGDIIYNKLFAWKGAFAIADASVDNCIASDKFPTYLMKGNIHKDFLALWFQTEELAIEARQLSRGAAALSKFTLNPPDFWKMPIPLPSTIDEQIRVSQKTNQILSKIDMVQQARSPIDAVLQGRRAGIGSDLRLVMNAALHRFAATFESDLSVLDEALSMKPRSGPSFPCSDNGDGISVVMPSALGGFRFDVSKCQFGDGTERLSEKDILNRGDLLISRGNKRDQVGLCIVYNSDTRRTYANLLMRFNVDQKRWRPDFVKYWIMNPLAVGHIRRHTKGTSPSVQKINQKGILSIPFPKKVSLQAQDNWILFLDRMFETAELLETYAREQNEDVLRARKAVLSAAFRGDL